MSLDGFARSSAPLGLDAPVLAPEQDPTPRPRDGRGGTLPRAAAYHVPTAGREPGDRSQFEALVARIEVRFPVRAAQARHLYDDKLVPAYRNVLAVRDAVEQERAAAARLAQERRGEFLVAAAQTDRAAAEFLAPFEAEQSRAQADLRQLESTAIAACGQIGVAYRPDVTEADLLAFRPVTVEEAAARAGIPLPEAGPSSAAKALVVLGTGVIGALTGVSIGVVAGVLDPSSLAYQAVPLAASAVVGVAVSGFARYFVRGVFSTAAEAGAQVPSEPRRAQVLYGQAYAALGVVLACYAAMERQGLMKLADQNAQIASLGGGAHAAPSGVVLFVVAMVLSLGYFLFSAHEGYRRGRARLFAARAAAAAAEENARALAARRGDPAVQRALAAVAAVPAVRRAAAAAAARAIEAEAEAERRRAAVAVSVTAESDSLTAEQRDRVQDALDDYRGAQQELDRLLEPLLEELEPVGGFFARLKRLFTRRPRRIVESVA